MEDNCLKTRKSEIPFPIAGERERLASFIEHYSSVLEALWAPFKPFSRPQVQVWGEKIRWVELGSITMKDHRHVSGVNWECLPKHLLTKW